MRKSFHEVGSSSSTHMILTISVLFFTCNSASNPLLKEYVFSLFITLRSLHFSLCHFLFLVILTFSFTL
ncbi:hypothetical protein Lalb_Chr10g0094451 [Lupinus albus]|uniref:Uncharacterized protein n=1 Tax=Lupinus albus TaxID=3870 RepID=A0A6A4PU08_LUPAL|nr:hypothetical protein Lalb_Chr10g0094451 [Lupinus albus]